MPRGASEGEHHDQPPRISRRRRRVGKRRCQCRPVHVANRAAPVGDRSPSTGHSQSARIARGPHPGSDQRRSRRNSRGRRLCAGDVSRRAAIVLSHNPDTVDLPGWGNYEGWILSGHAHGGQCKPPFLPPPLLPVRNRRYTAGEFALDGGRRMYISRGVGHLLQVRFNVRPEVTVFELRSA